MDIRAHRLYLRYVLRHKWFVFLAGLKLGVPLYRLILHDWTKFQPIEWFPYVRFFYGRGRTREKLGSYSADAIQDGDFELAWNHHQKRNDHHWQYWIRLGDDGTILYIPMPDVCRREMLADWRGAGRALGKPDTAAWYEANKDKMKLHPETRAWIERQLNASKFPIGAKVWASMDNCAWPGIVIAFKRDNPGVQDTNAVCYQVEMIPNSYTRADRPLWMFEGELSIATDEEIAAEEAACQSRSKTLNN